MIFKIGVVCVMEGPRYAIGLILVVLLGNFVSMVTEIIIGLLIASTKYIFNVLHLIGETMKNHMGLLAIWIALMALMARISIGELIYSSLIRLMNP